MQDRIEKRITELEQAREQLLGQLHAVTGALSELRRLGEPEEPVQAVNGEDRDSAEPAHGDG